MAKTDASLDNIVNFRDVAVSINSFQNKQLLRAGRLFRSARPDAASTSDKVRLQNSYGINSIIDLRSKTELLEAQQKHRQALEAMQYSSTTPASERPSDSLKIPGIRYTEINLNGKGFERHLAWQLSYYDLAWVIGYMLLGYRLDAVSIIGKKVLLPRGLIGLGRDTLVHSGPEVKACFDVLSNPKSYPLIIYCTQGKDRTGIIIMLVLMVCGIGLDAIAADYAKSEQELECEFERRMEEIKSIGLDESFARCPSSFVDGIASFIGERFDGVDSYLASIGVRPEQINEVRAQLLL